MADLFGTPLYVYDLDRIRCAVTQLNALVPQPSTIYYSLKANPHPVVVSCLLTEGCLAEVSSPAELNIALAAGADPAACLYTGPGKTDAELQLALRRGVALFSVESRAELARLAAASSNHKTRPACLLRVNLPDAIHGGLRMSGGPSQFGMDMRQLDFLEHAGDLPVGVAGLHFFSATNMPRQESLTNAFEAALAAAAQTSTAYSLKIERLDLGGGFAAPYGRVGGTAAYTSDLSRDVSAMLDGTFPGWRSGRPDVFFESGRFLTASAGVLLTRVVDIKESKDRRYAIVDAGINHLGGLAGLGRVLSNEVEPENVSRPGGSAIEEIDLVGSLCSPADTLARSVKIDVQIGDVLRINNVGAYGLTASLIGFLSRPTPIELVVDGDEIVSASRLELMRSEMVEVIDDG